MVVVDTSVWIQVLKFGAVSEVQHVRELITKNQVALVGVVFAELLQGARKQSELAGLKARLASLPYLAETRDTWSRVGELSYELRKEGRVISLPDLLIAALAMENGCSVFTLDEHFQHIPGVELYSP